MAARLVDLERDLGRVEDEVHLAGRALGSVEQRDRQLRGLLGALRELERTDRLESAGDGLATEGVGVAALLHLRFVDGGGLDSSAGLDDLLLDPRSGERRERLSLTPRDDAALADGDARDAGHGRIGVHQDPELLVEPDRERILLVRCSVRVGDRGRLVELDRLSLRDGRCACDLERLARDPLALLRLEHRARAESPCTVDEHTHAESGAGARGRGFEGAVLDGQALVLDARRCGRRHTLPRRAGRRPGPGRSVRSRQPRVVGQMWSAGTGYSTALAACGSRSRSVSGTVSISTWLTVNRALIDCWSRVRIPPGRSIAAWSPSGEPMALIRKLCPISTPSISIALVPRAATERAVMRMSSTAIASAPALRSS